MLKPCLIVLILLSISPVFAEQSPHEKGREIAVEMINSDLGWKDQTVDMLMTLRSPSGREVTREISLKMLEVIDDGDKSLAIFESPADVRGTVFLSHTHIRESDDQWLYLPAMKRTKRISNRSKSGPFMGSEYAYEDLVSNEVDKYTYRWLRDEEENGVTVHVMERYPEYKGTGYSKQVVRVDSEKDVLLQTDFYDKKGALLKTNIFSDYQLHDGKYWRAHTMEMTNHQSGKSTTLLWDNFRLSTNIGEREFDKSSLRRASVAQ